MSMKGLVEGDCGGSNPLLRLTSHFTTDRAHLQEGLGPARDLSEQGLVTEFLAETRQVTRRPQTFRMDSLLREMREIESPRHLGAVPRQAPTVAHLAVQGKTKINIGLDFNLFRNKKMSVFWSFYKLMTRSDSRTF